VQVDITARTSLSSFCSQWCNALLGGHCHALYDKKESEDDECVCPPSSNYGMNYTTFKQLWSVANTTSRLAFSFKGKKSFLYNCSAHLDVISWFLDDLWKGCYMQHSDVRMGGSQVIAEGKGVLNWAEGKSAGGEGPQMHHYTTGKRPFQTKVKFELARKERKRAWTWLSKAIIHSIWPCVCQKRLRSCLKRLAWVPPLSCHICHFSRNCFNINRVPWLYGKKKKPKFIMSNIEIMCYTGRHRSGSLLM
jgi:hypothetical protein